MLGVVVEVDVVKLVAVLVEVDPGSCDVVVVDLVIVVLPPRKLVDVVVVTIVLVIG